MTKVVVTGGRYYSDRGAVYWFLDLIDQEYGVSVLIHGDAKGADTLCKEWAEKRGKQAIAYPADWKRHGRYKAGFIRNQTMIDEGKPDLLVAFPGRNGTADMKARSGEAGLTIMEFDNALYQRLQECDCKQQQT